MGWCSMNRDQTPFEYIIGSEFTNMLGILTLFAIPAFKLQNKQIENVLFLLGVLCIAIYLVQYLFHLPLTIDQSEIVDKGQSLRVRVNGQCLFFLLYFKSLYDVTHKLSIYSLMILILSFLCILILGFRSHIAILLLLTPFFLWRNNKISGRFFVYSSIVVLFVFAISQTQVVQYKIDQMLERNETDNFDNENYVRISCFEYYTHDFPRNTTDRVLGTGLPNNNSTYGQQIAYAKRYGLVWADWGLIGLSWMLGIPAVLCIVWYCLLAFLTPTRESSSYLCYFFLFLLLASIMTREIYRQGAFPIQGVVLYLIAKQRVKKD